MVVCGSNSSLKSSISELILQHTHRRSESVRTDVDLHGRLINVLELPALFNTGLSEEEVMRQTLRCVSRCHPGVHAFLLIIPDAPLNNEDRAEMEEIQKIFSSRINKHIMILIKQNSDHQTAELNEETQTVIQSFGGRHQYFNPETQVSTLMENIEKMLEENRGGFYSTETFLEAQMTKLMKYKKMKKKLHLPQAHLTLQAAAENEDELRIVLLGKTGVGKSSTGNTILGRDAFAADISQESVTVTSQKESSEINGRLITVIDTPGLFDTELSNEEIKREISNCISMILPGPHVFIIVLNLGQRFTKEEETSVEFIHEMFGKKSLMFTMVLFTRGDDLKKKTIEGFLGKPGSVVRKLIESCRNRYHVFNNNQPEDRTQVSDLLEKIDNMVKANGGSFYSCKMFREMEREKQEQQTRILIDRVRETEEEMKKLKEENERMKMMMEKLEHSKEKQRMRRAADEYIKNEQLFKIQTSRELQELEKPEQKQKQRVKDEEKREKEKQSSDEQIQSFKYEIERVIKEKEKTEKERQVQLENLEKELKKEKKLREDQQKTFEEKLKDQQKTFEEKLKDQQKTFEEKLKLYEEQNEVELKRRPATSDAAIFGKNFFQKLKDPIEQSLYKKTARDLTNELRSNCESLNGNRSNLEKHILKTLAEEEDFDKYMNYFNNPRDHFKSFIRNEVSRYIRDKFSISVLPKMEENIKLLQQKIMNAAHQSTEHVQVNSGDVGLWLKSFTQQLSDQLIFSEKDLSGVKHDDVDDFTLLEDVIRQELTAVMSDISSIFNTYKFLVKLDYKFRPEELLIDHFCQCCWVQCPFCGVTCTNTIENHDGDHSAPLHKVRGIIGTYYHLTLNLCADICTNVVVSEQDMNAPNKRILLREHRSAGGAYANWNITPDDSELPYWKWFVCRFQKDLEKKYNKTFSGLKKIPDRWRLYSKQCAIKSLDQYI
nr:interferon-induced very large GTPase 1-like [Danio rerio]|eukprot:XP_017210387.1 interferon-induced very large GTPase 1-like [Danio rerio]